MKKLKRFRTAVLNLHYYIAQKIYRGRENSFSAVVARIASVSVALGIAVMIISFSILGGFEQNIKKKIFSFSAHIRVSKYDLNRSSEDSPIRVNSELYSGAQSVPGIEHIQTFGNKPGLIKTKDEVAGAVFKGVGGDFDPRRFQKNITRGHLPFPCDTGSESKDIVISEKLARKLKLDTGSTLLMYFIQDPPRARKFTVRGLYNTGIEDFDEMLVLGDLRTVQKLNGWGDSLVGGYEIFVKNFDELDLISEKVLYKMDYDMGLETVTGLYMQLFDWLNLLNRNVYIFMGLIIFVACFNVISTLLIMIMERTNMIGVMKALGADNSLIRKIFLYNGILLTLRGLLRGNLLAMGLCAIQYYFKVIPLNPENYYMDTVPIMWDFPLFLLLNAIIFMAVVASLFIPLAVISKMNPLQSVKFD